jgi:hypothetical protein
LEADSGAAKARDPRAGSFANPIDRFMAAYFQQHGQNFSPVVADAVFARRAYLDVWGLLPTPAQLDRFLNETQPGKREKLVDALLSDRKNYSEHWISFWNDLLRNDEGVAITVRQTITTWLMSGNETSPTINCPALQSEKPEDPQAILSG